MVEGVDFSAARPSGLCLSSKGKLFAGRYFGPGGDWKHASKAEVAALTSFGVSIVSLVEGFAADAKLGFNKGIEHARSGLAAATATGMPDGRPLYFAVDFDASTAQLSKVADYMRGAASVIGIDRVGVYGGYRTIDYLWRAGVVTWYMQTLAWSYGKWHSQNHIEQYRNGVTVCGGEVDLCRSKQTDYGQWRPGQDPTREAKRAEKLPPVETPWEFVDVLSTLGSQVLSVGTACNQAAAAIEAL